MNQQKPNDNMADAPLDPLVVAAAEEETGRPSSRGVDPRALLPSPTRKLHTSSGHNSLHMVPAMTFFGKTTPVYSSESVEGMAVAAAAATGKKGKGTLEPLDKKSSQLLAEAKLRDTKTTNGRMMAKLAKIADAEKLHNTPFIPFNRELLQFSMKGEKATITGVAAQKSKL